MRKERVDVRVEPELLDELDVIMEREGLRSRSEVIREAVAEYVLENRDGWNSSQLKVSVPNRLAERIQRLIMNGDARDAQEAVVLALDRWASNLEEYYLEGREKMVRIVADNVRRDGNLSGMEAKGRELRRR